MNIIGIGGRKRSGKDEIAKVLRDEFGYIRMAFSDAIVDACHHVFRTPTREYRDTHPDAGRLRFRYVGGLSPARRIWQEFGEGIRNLHGHDHWIRILQQRIDDVEGVDPKIVVTGVRYPNEAHWIIGLGGRLWRVERPGTDALDNHITEHALDGFSDWDAVIVNDGTLDKLLDRVRELMAPEA
jgi:hypothetical protein